MVAAGRFDSESASFLGSDSQSTGVAAMGKNGLLAVRRKPFLRLLLFVAAFLVTIHLFFRSGTSESASIPLLSDTKSSSQHDSFKCASLPGANDTLVILKTGSTELKDKLPIHFSTTLKCYPNYMLFSDYGEEFESHQIIDALESVDPAIKSTHADFDLWRRLQQQGRAALAPSELSGSQSPDSPATGKTNNPGWKLDKWKFLPMVERTLHDYPDMKWYVFVETDTGILWRNTLELLARLDHTKPHYLGSQMQIAEVVFAHGGSAFAVSQAAMEHVVDHYQKNKAQWEKFTDGHWAGDCVLGKAFKDAGVELTWAWPVFQGVKPGAIDYTRLDYNKKIWCQPAMSYHHMSPDEVEDLWKFDQEWTRANKGVALHRDVFHSYLLPRVRPEISDWDNMSGDFKDDNAAGAKPDATTFEACRDACVADEKCAQFAISLSGKCRTSANVMLGEVSASGTRSGWLINRVERFEKEREREGCADAKWAF